MTTEPTCAATDDGHPCYRTPVMQRPIVLCNAHRLEIALTVVPQVLRDQLATALQHTATVPAVRNDLVATARTATVADLLHGVHDSVVYFIANGGRVKIGYTTNLKARLASLALRPDAVLLALHGGPELERALHHHFAQHRDGNTEWFDLAPSIARYVAAQRPTTDPATLQRNTAGERASRNRNGASLSHDAVAATYRQLAARSGRPPSDRELGVALGVRRSRAQQLRTAAAANGHTDLAKQQQTA